MRSPVAGLRERFPAVARLERRRKRTIPYTQQLHATDCGAACVTMVLRLHGRETRLDDVRERMGITRDGVNAHVILETARQFGLRGRAVRLEPRELDHLGRGAILHWKMNHFVVLDRARGRHVHIVDPASGPRVVPRDEFNRSFTGIAIDLEPTDSFVREGKGPSRTLRHLARMLRDSRQVIRVVAASVVVQILPLALPVLTGAVVDRVVPRGDADLLRVIFLGILAITGFTFLASLLRAHLLVQLRTQLDVRMTLDFFDHLLRLPFSYFQLRQTGDLLMRLNSNAIIRETLTSATTSALLDGTLVLSYVVVLFWVHPPLAVLVLALGALRVGIFLGSRRSYRRYMTESLQAQAESSNYQVQIVEGIETLKATAAEGRAMDRWSTLFVNVMNVSVRQGKLSGLVEALLAAVGTASPLLLLAYGAHLVLQGELTLGTMLAMNALAAGFLSPLSSLVSAALRLQTVGSYLERVDDVLEQRREREGRPGAACACLRGDIELRRVSFRYGEGAPLALRDIDLHVRRGTEVAIVGPSGCGKSTLARLLVGLYEPHEGQILFDGSDLRDIDLASLRRQIGFVSQNPFLFAGAIRANIALQDDRVPLPEIQRAAELAGIHDDVMEMPLRYETLIASGGANLSGGQRQRLTIARALLRHPAILVLDEATSHLDAIAERRVQENLRAMASTRVVVAHRLSTVRDSDQILVMDQGTIVERGTHDELQKTGSLYGRLLQAQRGDS